MSKQQQQQQQQQQQLARFIDQNVSLPRVNAPYPMSWRVQYARPTAHELAELWLAMAEFEALRLGTWLDTPEGEFFAEAIEMVSPPFYRAHVDLLVEALQIAAREQQHRGRRNVALGVGALVLVSLLFGLGHE